MKEHEARKVVFNKKKIRPDFGLPYPPNIIIPPDIKDDPNKVELYKWRREYQRMPFKKE
jgi:hypothetical protein